MGDSKHLSDEMAPDIANICVPDTPPLGKLRNKTPGKLHVLGDLHGWTPGLINYLIKHKLAEISIDGKPLGVDGKTNIPHMAEFFGRTESGKQKVGLRGFELHEDAASDGLGPIKARWIAESDVSFVQIGDVFDRADYSEIAVEILRQLIIDAPDRVFVLVGNHEQFMLEGSVDNWLLNEERNAIKNYEDLSDGTVGRHTRFLPEGNYENYAQKATEAIFPCYRNSVFTLYLTQAAAQQKSGFINRGLGADLVDSLLSQGWEPYKRVEDELESLMVKDRNIPGAIVALVIGDNLFHHAEPGEYLIELPDSINWVESYNIGWIDYNHGGGSIQGTQHSPYLWTRGSSSGALSGSPKFSDAITPLAKAWPGLFRIVHGHTPTISDEEFRKNMNSLNSTVCSYFAHKQNHEPSRGIASNIRIYNVDEAMSPVYYKGSSERDDILRIPHGLKVAKEDEIKKKVIIHRDDDPLLTIDPTRDVRKDTREFWKWNEGQYRLTALENNPDEIFSNQGHVLDFANMRWLIKASEIGNVFIMKYLKQIQDLILDIIDKSELDLTDLTTQEPEISSTLPYLSHEGIKPFTHQNNGKPSFTAKDLTLSIFGFNENGNLVMINATENPVDYYYFSEKGDKEKITNDSYSINHSKITMNSPVIFSFDKKYSQSTLNYWLGKTVDEPELNIPSISYWPKEKAKKYKIKTLARENFSDIIDSEKKISDTLSKTIPSNYYDERSPIDKPFASSDNTWRITKILEKGRKTLDDIGGSIGSLLPDSPNDLQNFNNHGTVRKQVDDRGNSKKPSSVRDQVDRGNSKKPSSVRYQVVERGNSKKPSSVRDQVDDRGNSKKPSGVRDQVGKNPTLPTIKNSNSQNSIANKIKNEKRKNNGSSRVQVGDNENEVKSVVIPSNIPSQSSKKIKNGPLDYGTFINTSPKESVWILKNDVVNQMLNSEGYGINQVKFPFTLKISKSIRSDSSLYLQIEINQLGKKRTETMQITNIEQITASMKATKSIKKKEFGIDGVTCAKLFQSELFLKCYEHFISNESVSDT